MGVYESILLGLITMGLLFYKRLGSVGNRRAVALILLVFFFLHVMKDGFRWQMIPGYLMAIPALINLTRKEHVRTIIGAFLGVIYFVIIVAAWVIPIMIPTFSFSAPEGNNRVGYTWITITDTARLEGITPAITDYRKIAAKIWFPATERDPGEHPYLEGFEREGIAREYEIPAWLLSHFNKADTYVLENSAARRSSSPVLIFSPGYQVCATQYYSFIPEIVSQGYVVVNLSHTYENLATPLEDEVVWFDREFATSTMLSEEMLQLEQHAGVQFDSTSDEQRKAEIVRQLIDQSAASDLVRRWAADISSAINSLEVRNRNPRDPLYQTMDLDNIAVAGHSYGGAAAGQAAQSDERIKAIINWDGGQYGELMGKTLRVPYLMIYAEKPDNFIDLNPYVFENAGRNLDQITITGASHTNFSDVPLWLNYDAYTRAGSISPQRMAEVLPRVMVKWLDKHLRNRSFNLDTWVNQQDEILMGRW